MPPETACDALRSGTVLELRYDGYAYCAAAASSSSACAAAARAVAAPEFVRTATLPLSKFQQRLVMR